MGQEEFRLFFEKTARQLWAYLMRVSGDPGTADDLLQESYLRLLRSSLPADAEEAHRRNYLYRIATNLLRDRSRQRGREGLLSEAKERASWPTSDQDHSVHSALARLRPVEREMLWLAYVEGASHAEIAEVTGYTRLSIRPLLSRARRRLARMLEGGTDK